LPQIDADKAREEEATATAMATVPAGRTYAYHQSEVGLLVRGRGKLKQQLSQEGSRTGQ